MKAEYRVFPHPSLDWRLAPYRHTNFRLNAKYFASREEIEQRREERIDVPQQLANFARMGFLCLVTDMIGKVDSRQITHDYGRDEMELWQSNGLGIQFRKVCLALSGEGKDCIDHPAVQQMLAEGAASELANDQDYLEHFHVPGIMLVGGVEGALSLADCPVHRF